MFLDKVCQDFGAEILSAELTKNLKMLHENKLGKLPKNKVADVFFFLYDGNNLGILIIKQIPKLGFSAPFVFGKGGAVGVVDFVGEAVASVDNIKIHMKNLMVHTGYFVSYLSQSSVYLCGALGGVVFPFLGESFL